MSYSIGDDSKNGARVFISSVIIAIVVCHRCRDGHETK
jgi:hypothetical protein